MRGKRIRLSILSALPAAGAMHAWAETPSENAPVTAAKSREVPGAFTQVSAAGAPVQIAADGITQFDLAGLAAQRNDIAGSISFEGEVMRDFRAKWPRRSPGGPTIN